MITSKQKGEQMIFTTLHFVVPGTWKANAFLLGTNINTKVFHFPDLMCFSEVCRL